MAGVNPFRRKQMQILGLDNASFVPSVRTNRSSRSSDDGSSTISHFSDKGSAAASLNSRSNSTRKTSIVSPNINPGDAGDGDFEKRSYSAGGDSTVADSTYNEKWRESGESGNPFEEDDEDDSFDSLDELEGKHTTLRRRRTVPSKAASRLDAGSDNPWRNSSAIGNHPAHRRGSPDSLSVPLKAQKTLGISKQGRLMSADDFRRTHSLSPATDNVAPKAQRMLGIPSNPFQRNNPAEDRHFFNDELEREGSRGPITNSIKPMDVDEFKRMILTGERNPRYPQSFRDSSSNTDISSVSRSSIISSQPDTYVETPRSSHEYHQRPHLTRIATDSALNDGSLNVNKPWTHDPFSPIDAAESPILNKPLPRTPDHTFELAGSDPVYAGRRRKVRNGVPESIEEIPSPRMIAELPAEPIILHHNIYEMEASPVPGTSAAPIELPAREASPVDPPPIKWQSLNFPRDTPAPPPPRRSSSTRSSIEIPRLSARASESALNQKNKPIPPPARGSSVRYDRAIAQSLPPANIPSPEFSLSWTSSRSAPQPPPSRNTTRRDFAEAAEPAEKQTHARPITPTNLHSNRNPQFSNPDSPYSRLPPLQTTPNREAESKGDIVSAMTRDSAVTFSSEGISTMSPSTPASRRAGLNFISKAAGRSRDSSHRNSKEDLRSAVEVVPTPREPKPSHQREWSWEPGKIDRIDSIKRSDSGNEGGAHEEGDQKTEIREVIEEEDYESDEENQDDDRGKSHQEEKYVGEDKVDVLAGLDALKKDVDDALNTQSEMNRADEYQKSANVDVIGGDTLLARDTQEQNNSAVNNTWI